jgi:hypothetical protein
VRAQGVGVTSPSTTLPVGEPPPNKRSDIDFAGYEGGLAQEERTTDPRRFRPQSGGSKSDGRCQMRPLHIRFCLREETAEVWADNDSGFTRLEDLTSQSEIL